MGCNIEVSPEIFETIEKHLRYNNNDIFYRVIGNGKPVMLIHGFGEDGEVWNAMLDPSNEISLTDKHRFIIPDLPGSGKSEMVDNMSMEGLAEVIKTIIDTEFSYSPPSEGSGEAGGRGAAIPVIGHSMGGYIALAFSEKYPALISGLGLFHSSAFADSEEKKATRRKGIEFIQKNGAFEFLKTTTPNLFAPKNKDERPELIDQILQAADNFSPSALVSYYESMMARPDRTEILRKTTVPVLFIMGKYDGAVPVEDGLKQSHLPGKSYIHILRNAGHMGMLEETVKAISILDKFLLQL